MLTRTLLSPWIHLALSLAFVTAAELLLKHGADLTRENTGGTDWTGVSSLGSPWVWAGIACYLASFASWLRVLRSMPLIIAFNLMNLVHVLVPLGCWIILGERLPPQRVAGIAMIVAGVGALARPLAALEERL